MKENFEKPDLFLKIILDGKFSVMVFVEKF